MRLVGVLKCGKGVSLPSVLLLAIFVFSGGNLAKATAAEEASTPTAVTPELRNEVRNEISLGEDQLLTFVRGLVAAGGFDKAQQLIAEARPNVKDTSSLDFLEAHMTERGGDLTRANEIYRQILNRNPRLARVRLSLARNLFIQRKDRAARYHYEYALAGDLPPVIRQLILRNLAAMRARQTWALNFGISLTSNSNVNTGPDQSHVDMFDLPFELSDDARQASGNGLSGWISGKWLIGEPRGVRLRSEAGFNVVEHEGRLYDDGSVWISSGPQWQTSRETIWLAATTSNRWLAGEDYRRTVGARARLERALPAGKLVTADVAYRSADYSLRSYDDGGEMSLALSLSAALDANTRGRIISHSGWFKADQPAWSWKRLGLGVFWMREFPQGITVEINPEISVQRWQGLHPTFRKVREDLRGRVSLSVRRRGWRIFGFVPVVGYEYLNSSSTIELYEFNRHWMTMGVARSL